MPASRFAAEDVLFVMRLNYDGTVYVLDQVVPAMLKRGAGHLVVTSSLAGYRGLPNAAAYSAAKSALTNMMESLRVDLAPGADGNLLSVAHDPCNAFSILSETSSTLPIPSTSARQPWLR